MFSLSANAPTLFPTVTALPASVCAEVSAAARSRVDVGDLDELVRARCKLREQQPAADDGSRLLQQLAQVRQLTGESDPFIALSSVLREARQLRALRAQLLKLTAQPDGATALRAVENESRELGELRAFEATVCAALGCSDRRLVAGELEARSQLHERLCLFARVDHPASAGRGSAEADDGDAAAPPAPAAGAELQAVGAAGWRTWLGGEQQPPLRTGGGLPSLADCQAGTAAVPRQHLCGGTTAAGGAVDFAALSRPNKLEHLGLPSVTGPPAGRGTSPSTTRAAWRARRSSCRWRRQSPAAAAKRPRTRRCTACFARASHGRCRTTGR